MEDVHRRQIYKHLRAQLCGVQVSGIETSKKRIGIVDKWESKAYKYNGLWLDYPFKKKSAESRVYRTG
jgi:hypothetical protein